MAKYKLTITDVETGEIKHEEACDGIMGATICRIPTSLKAPKSINFVKSLSRLDVISLLMALDMSKTGVLATDPVTAEAYSLRDEIFPERVSINIDELENQAGAE